MEDLNMYMENLDEYINDENKLVTYKWLSITLNIPCNAAKRLLHHFICKQEKDKSIGGLHVTYLVIGSSSADGVLQTKVCIVPQEKLSQVQQSLTSVSSVHVYSISKSRLKDHTAALYGADYDCVRQNLTSATKHGGIVCTAAAERSDADIASLKKLGTFIPSTPQDSRSAPDPRLAKASGKSASTAGDEVPKNGCVDNHSKSSRATGEKTKSAKGSLASMFAAQKNVKKEPKESEDTEENNAQNNIKKEPKENGDTKENNSENKVNKVQTDSKCKKLTADNKKACRISGFFTKGVNLRENESKEIIQLSPTEQNGSCVKNEVKKELEQTDGEKKDNLPQKSSPNKRKPTGRPKKAITQSKRSRILQVESDSSEDDDTASEIESTGEPENPVPSPTRCQKHSSDEEEPAPARRSPLPCRGKKRKLVDRTFQDEDGFFVTKKEYVDVTDSDSEDPAPPLKRSCSSSSSPAKTTAAERLPEEDKASKPVKDNASKPVKKVAAAAKKQTKTSPVKAKQASIMSFFKKK